MSTVTTGSEYQKIFSEFIEKQIVILGPDVTFGILKNLHGIHVNSQGVVTSIGGDPTELLQNLVNQFGHIAGTVAKKTMESIVQNHPGIIVPVLTSTDSALKPQVQPTTHLPQSEIEKAPTKSKAAEQIQELNNILNTVIS